MQLTKSEQLMVSIKEAMNTTSNQWVEIASAYCSTERTIYRLIYSPETQCFHMGPNLFTLDVSSESLLYLDLMYIKKISTNGYKDINALVRKVALDWEDIVSRVDKTNEIRVDLDIHRQVAATLLNPKTIDDEFVLLVTKVKLVSTDTELTTVHYGFNPSKFLMELFTYTEDGERVVLKTVDLKVVMFGTVNVPKSVIHTAVYLTRQKEVANKQHDVKQQTM